MRSLPKLSLCALWAALSVAPAALADNAADEADLAFELGNQAYAKGHYAEALAEYFVSHRLVPNRNVLFNIARCYEQLDRFDEAYRYYHDLLSLELPAPDRQEVVRALSRIRPRVALVQVVTEPPGADVFLDREDLGSRGLSPQVVALPPGKHAVKVRLAGYLPRDSEVTLARGREVAERLSLEPVLGRAELRGTPEGAEIRDSADGPLLGRVPAKIPLPVGRRLLYVSAPGYGTAQYLAEVKQDGTAQVAVALSPAIGPSGKLVVTANRPNARVRVDGKESGFTPTVVAVPVGEHEVEISLPEMRTLRQTVQVPKDAEVPVFAELRYAPPPVRAASKSLLALDEAPASTSVITADEIRAFGYTTLPEALEAIRGVFSGDDGQYTYLGIRGFAPPGDLNTRILILWDGHAMNDVWAGQGYLGRDLNVDLDEVDRIEVVRGPGSALYGTSALFAVINVVPRDHLGAGEHVEAAGSIGGPGAWRAHVTGALGGEGGPTALLSGSVYRADGAPLTDLGSAGVVRGLDGERVYDASGRVRWGPFTLMGGFNWREKDIPTGPYGTTLNVPGTRTRDARGFAELRYERELSFGAVSARAYYDASRYIGNWAYDDGAGAVVDSDDGGADWVGGEARIRVGLWKGNQLTVGVEGQQHLRVEHASYQGTPNDGPLPTINRTMLSAYALDEWAIHPRAFVSLGLRLDKYLDLSALPITPRLALILRPYDGGVTKLVAGQAFRAPNVYELFNHDYYVSIMPAGPLGPETITTVEFEHSHELTHELKITASGYWNRITDLVVLTERADNPPLCGAGGAPVQCLQYQNHAEPLQALGAEGELEWQAGRFAMIDLAYSYVYLIGSTGKITATPAHLVSGRALFPIGESGMRLAVQAKYQSARAEEGATASGEALLVDFGISGEAANLRYFAGVMNLLDTRFALPFGPEYATPALPQAGRQFRVQLTASY